MTPLFWIIIVVMTGGAIAFVIVPLLRSHWAASPAQRNALNIAIYKERLAELEQEALSSEELAQTKQELDKTLAQELEAVPADTPQEPRQRANIYASLVITIVIPALAIGSYLYLGKPQLIDTVTQQNAESPPDIETMVKKLAERLQQQPDDVTGWQVLARSYIALERYEEAVQVYEQLLSLVGQDPAVLTDLAEVLAMTQQGQWQGRPSELLATALTLDANAQKTLWLAGVAAVQQEDYPLALQHWEHLLTQVPATEEEKRQLLQKQITRLEALLQGKDISPPTSPTAAINLNVTVKLPADLQPLVKQTDTVFIYARAPEGPPMPLAVIKKTVADLPTTVVLNQSHAVVASTNLADFEAVTLVARIAKSGQVIPQTGDLQGQQTKVSVYESNPIEIIINEVIP